MKVAPHGHHLRMPVAASPCLSDPGVRDTCSASKIHATPASTPSQAFSCQQQNTTTLSPSKSPWVSQSLPAPNSSLLTKWTQGCSQELLGEQENPLHTLMETRTFPGSKHSRRMGLTPCNSIGDSEQWTLRRVLHQSPYLLYLLQPSKRWEQGIRQAQKVAGQGGSLEKSIQA